MSFRADVRAACLSLLDGYRDAVIAQRATDGDPRPFRLTTYPARPRSVAPPHAFVDTIAEQYVYTGPLLVQRTATAELVLVHGLFDTKEAVDQADEFTDGFLAYVTGEVHEAGANTTIGVTSAVDDPTFVNDWVKPEEQRTWFATRITLEGFAET